jgi:hypothetical protein
MQVNVVECRKCPVIKQDFDSMIGWCAISKITLYDSIESLSQLDMDKIHATCPLRKDNIVLNLTV